jgi:hypothetical protein
MVDDLLSIFKHLKRAPTRFGETAIGTLVECLSQKQFRPHVHLEPDDHSDLLQQVTGISGIHQADYSMPLSRISSIPVILLVTAREFLTFRLYQSFCHFMDSLKSARIRDEILHQILFNPWIWCATKSFGRTYRNWPTLLEQSVLLIKRETFVSFLIQCHLLATRSTHSFGEFCQFQFRILGQLANVIFINHASVLPLIAVVLNCRNHQDQLLGCLRVLIGIASRNSACFDNEIVYPLIDVATEKPEPVIFCHVFELIRTIRGHEMKSRVAHLCLAFFPKAVPLEISFLDVMCIQALFIKAAVFSFPHDQKDDDFWYFWPIIVALVYQQEAEISVLSLLLSGMDDYSNVLNLLAVFEAVGVEYASELRDKFVARALEIDKTVAVRSFVALYYKLKSSPFSPDLLALMKRMDVCEIPEIPEVPTTSLRPFSLQQLHALAKCGGDSELMFEKQRSSVNVLGFLDPDFLSISGIESFQAEVISKLQGEMKAIFHGIDRLLDIPAYSCDFNPIYRELIGREMSRWNNLIENGLIEIDSPHEIRRKDFHCADLLIECPVLKLAERVNDKWDSYRVDNAEAPFRAFTCQFRIGQNWVRAAIDIMDKGFQVRIHGYLPLFLLYELVSFIRIFPNDLVIYLRDSTSFEIRMENPENFVKIPNFEFFVVSDPTRAVNKAVDLWTRGTMSNFEYLMCLNILNGRTFCDLGNYPFFPVIGSRQGLTRLSSTRKVDRVDFTGWFDGSDVDLNQAQRHGSFPPELYGSISLLKGAKVTQPSWSPSTEFFVYNYRKSLEHANADLPEWISNQFGIHKARRFREEILHLSGPLTRIKSMQVRVHRAGVIGNFQNLMYIFSNAGSISLWLVDWHERVTLTLIGTASSDLYSDKLQIVQGTHWAIGVDTQSMTIFKITPDQRLLSQRFSTFVTSLATIGSSVVFVVDFHDVFICRANEFPSNARHLHGEVAPISRLVIDATLGVLVIITKSGLLKMVSLVDRRRLGQLDFVGKNLGVVLVTETWHLLVIECCLKVYVATLYGKILKTEELFKPMGLAVTFRLMSGGDFVAFVDNENALKIFEAFYPEKLQLLSRIKNPVIGLEYLREPQLILIIERDGHLSKLRFPWSSS